MQIALLIIWGMYFLFLVIVIFGWVKKTPKNQGGLDQELLVVVPFRNEAGNLERIAQSLEKQRYKEFSVVFVNDHSSDDSVAVLKSYLQNSSLAWRLIELEKPEGKKAAITAGIGQAGAELIVTTDADCWMGPEWLTSISAAFNDGSVAMVAGAVAFQNEPSLFKAWQSLEFSTLIGTGGALMKLGKPIMCNGANLAYRREAFEQVNGFEGISQTPSGDDELLMHKVAIKFPRSVTFLQEKEAVVSTCSAKTWNEFIQQRKRWASKWKIGKRPITAALALLVLLFHVGFGMSLVSALVGSFPWSLLGALLATRFLLELMLTSNIATRLNTGFKILPLLLSQFFYPFYAIFFGLLANFGSYEWKGRSYKV